MLEKRIERKFIKEAKRRKLTFYKARTPSRRSAPDRIGLIKGGVTVFIEFKKPGEVLRPAQSYCVRTLDELGFRTYLVSSLEEIDEVLDEIQAL